MLSLPDELVNLVFDHLNQIQITRLRLLNKRISNLVTAKLYRSVHVRFCKVRILVIDNLHLPFYLSRSTINTRTNFNKLCNSPHLNLVKNLYIYEDSSVPPANSPTRKVSLFKPETKISRERFFSNGNETSFRSKGGNFNQIVNRSLLSRRINCICIAVSFELHRDNFTVTKLSFNTELMAPGSIGNISKLKALKCVEISGKKISRVITKLENYGVEDLRIKELAIRIAEYDINGLQRLEECFNLESLDTFQFETMHCKLPDTRAKDLKGFFSRLVNVKSLYLSPEILAFANIMGEFKPNTLEMFAFKHTPHDLDSLYHELEKNLRNQEASIMAIRTGGYYPLLYFKDAFECVLKVHWKVDVDLIRYMKENSSRYPKLKHLIIGNNYCFVERYGKEVVNIKRLG